MVILSKVFHAYMGRLNVICSFMHPFEIRRTQQDTLVLVTIWSNERICMKQFFVDKILGKLIGVVLGLILWFAILKPYLDSLILR